MEQTISKFPNPFGSVAPHKLFAWGLSATVGYGFAIWGVRIYQNQTVELGGQLLVVLMQAFVLPALLYGADRLRRRLPADATALFGGLLFAQIPRLAASAGSAWLYAWLLPLGNGSVSPLQETMRAGGSAVLGSVTVLCGIWSMIWGWQAFCRATHAKGLRSIAVYAGCYVLAGHPARNHSSNAAARLALELVAKTTKGNTGGSGQSERLSRSARFIGQSGRFCRSYRLRRRSISKRDLQRNRSRTATVAAPAGR